MNVFTDYHYSYVVDVGHGYVDTLVWGYSSRDDRDRHLTGHEQLVITMPEDVKARISLLLAASDGSGGGAHVAAVGVLAMSSSKDILLFRLHGDFSKELSSLL